MNEYRRAISNSYSVLSRTSQIAVLARIANWLTFVARETYDREFGVSDGARLRAFNEAIGRIMAQMVRLLDEDQQRYPDDIFANILVDQFRILELDLSDLAKFFD